MGPFSPLSLCRKKTMKITSSEIHDFERKFIKTSPIRPTMRPHDDELIAWWRDYLINSSRLPLAEIHVDIHGLTDWWTDGLSYRDTMMHLVSLVNLHLFPRKYFLENIPCSFQKRDRRTDRWSDVWMIGRTDDRTDRWSDGQTLLYHLAHKKRNFLSISLIFVIRIYKSYASFGN